MKKAKKQLDLEVDAKRKMEQEARDIKPQPYDYYLICDVEATCQEGSTFDYENEIIEFPVILVDGSSMTEIDVFHAYVKPLIHSELSEFCTRLTGIQQKTVDEAEPFHSVYADFKEWLNTRVNFCY